MNAQERHELLRVLQDRFERHMPRHQGIAWADVRARIGGQTGVLRALRDMEASGGEPDLVDLGSDPESYTFCDCSAESPVGRRSLCYDRAARESRKAHAPADSALEMAAALGIDLLTEEQYRALQTFGEFDTRTSSWIATPPDIRKLGGALFGDRRFGRVFIYHNGAQSYYAARGFRGVLRVAIAA